MIWMLLLPVLVLADAHDRIIQFQNLKLKLVGDLTVCPDVSSLTRDSDMHWHAPGGWLSYNISFSRDLYSLVGVQWQGDKVGNIFCQYKDNSRLTFPVSLQAPGIYLRPTGNWQQLNKNHTMNCEQRDLTLCKFQRVEELVETYHTDEQLYDFLENIKKGTNE